MGHTDVSLRVNRRSGALPLDSSSTFVVWVGEFSGRLSAVRQMLADVPPPRFLVASQKCAVKHHTSLAEGLKQGPRKDMSVRPTGQTAGVDFWNIKIITTSTLFSVSTARHGHASKPRELIVGKSLLLRPDQLALLIKALQFMRMSAQKAEWQALVRELR